MRVVAGSARSILLSTPSGNDTRPTTDRIKETLFNIIQLDVPGSRVLDLFAGSGALGIESLSRGAECACFVDKKREAVACVTDNVKRAGFENVSTILYMDFASAIGRLKTDGRKFDLVFLDPPYDKGLEIEALRLLAMADVLDDDALVIVEASAEHSPEALEGCGFTVERIKTYKTNKHYFLRKA